MKPSRLWFLSAALMFFTGLLMLSMGNRLGYATLMAVFLFLFAGVSSRKAEL